MSRSLASRTARCLVLCALSAAALLAQAAAAAPLAPGEYAAPRGQGTLRIQPAKGATQTFSIDAFGANGHMCSVEGSLKDGVPQPIADAPGCQIALKFEGEAIAVSHNPHQDCRYFCGARADFEGRYARLPARCARGEASALRKRFKQLYDKRDYAAARAVLEPQLAECAPFLDRFALGGLRNDLAITQFHAGDKAACLATLAPLKEEAVMSEAQLREQYPPVDAESAVTVARAARTNLRKCEDMPK